MARCAQSSVTTRQEHRGKAGRGVCPCEPIEHYLLRRKRMLYPWHLVDDARTTNAPTQAAQLSLLSSRALVSLATSAVRRRRTMTGASMVFGVLLRAGTKCSRFVLSHTRTALTRCLEARESLNAAS